MNEPPICARCEDEYNLRDGMEPTKYCDACAHERVAELEEKSEWISVKDRLPNVGVDVLLWLCDLDDPDISDKHFGKRTGMTVGHLDENAYGQVITRPLATHKEQWPAWDIGDVDNYHRATHWMPLPEPPK